MPVRGAASGIAAAATGASSKSSNVNFPLEAARVPVAGASSKSSNVNFPLEAARVPVAGASGNSTARALGSVLGTTGAGVIGVATAAISGDSAASGTAAATSSATATGPVANRLTVALSSGAIRLAPAFNPTAANGAAVSPAIK